MRPEQLIKASPEIARRELETEGAGSSHHASHQLADCMGGTDSDHPEGQLAEGTEPHQNPLVNRAATPLPTAIPRRPSQTGPKLFNSGTGEA